MNTYVNKESRVLFIKGVVAKVSVPGAFSTSDGNSYFQPSGNWLAQPGTITSLINASNNLDTIGSGGNDPNNHHIRVFVVKGFGGYALNGEGGVAFRWTPITPYIIVTANNGSDPNYSANYFNVICGHEVGHELGLATQNLSLGQGNHQYAHDTGPFPLEFNTDAWGTPNQTGMMYFQAPAQNYWIRHEDWQEANYYAVQFLQ